MNIQLFNIQYDYFRFLVAADRQKAYLVILGSLFEERLAHQIEIFHDDLFLKVANIIEELTAATYPEALFRQDIDQLVEWGNINRKLEGRRVRSLTDNSLRRNILKISEETFQLVRFLLLQSRPRQNKTAARGFLLLQDLDSMLNELEALLENFYEGNRTEPALQRAMHVIESMDAKIDDAVAELTGLADQLHSFLDVKSEFELDSFVAIISQLESYNQAYLSRLTTMVDQIFSRLRAIERHLCFNEFIASFLALDENIETSEGSTMQKFQLLLAFFDPGSGKLDFYCQRVHAELYDALRRIRNHLRIRRDKTLRIEEIRSRIKDMTTATAQDCCSWVERLFSPVVIPMLAADGTPTDKSVAPLPRRNSNRIGAMPQAQAIAEKLSTPEESRELERFRIQKLNEFFLTKVLNNQDENHVCNAQLNSIEDIKRYMQGLKLSIGRNRRQSETLQVRFARPETDAKPASFDLDSCDFTCPDHLIRRKKHD